MRGTEATAAMRAAGCVSLIVGLTGDSHEGHDARARRSYCCAVDEAALRRGLSKLPTLPLNPVARELYEHFDRYRVERFVSAANELLKAAAENPVLRSCAILVGFLTPDKMHGIHPYTGALWSEHSTTISVARRTMDRQGMAPFSKTQKEIKREEEERARAAKRSSKYGQYVVNA